MRGLVSLILVSSLLLSSIFVQRAVIPTVKAAIHQGDLVIDGNTVYTIEGRFDINGSIVVKDNATLILKDAFLNFTQSRHFQYSMIFQDPLNGYPRLVIENATIWSNGYLLRVYLLSTSEAMINRLSADAVSIELYDYSSAVVSNSTVFWVDLEHSSTLSAANSTIEMINSLRSSETMLKNCTMDYLIAASTHETAATNCTINDSIELRLYNASFSVGWLKPVFAVDWSLELNFSVPAGRISNVTLHDTWVGGWSFYVGRNSNATIFYSELVSLKATDANVFMVGSIISLKLDGSGSSTLSIYNTTVNILMSSSDCTFWLINSTYNILAYVMHQSMIHVSWYLDVHVMDSIGQNVSSATVTAFYPSATIADSESTGSDGWVRFILKEKTINATAEYPVGNYTIETTYEANSNSMTVNVTENKQITLSLDFVVPEFPSFFILSLFMIATLLAVVVYKRKHH